MTIDQKLILNVFMNFKKDISTIIQNPLPSIESLANSLGYEQKDYYCSSESDWNSLSSFMTGTYNSGIWGVIHNIPKLG